MLFPTFTVLSVLASLTSALPAHGNHHGGINRPRRAHHFGQQQQQALANGTVAAAAAATPQPPPGAKVFTTKIENPRAGAGAGAGNSSLIQLNEGGVVERGEGVVELEKRGGPVGKRAFSGMRATYYAIGLGACGQYDAEPAYIVALNSAQYGGGYPGPQCFKSITIVGGNRNGHAVATIKDECPTCPYGGLDMSEALFSNFASADDGVATITWWYNDDAPPPPEPTTSSTPAYTPPTTSSEPAWTPPPSTSTTPAYTPPTTSEAPATSSVYTPPPPPPSTSSTWVAPTTSSTSSSVAPTTSSTSSSASSSSVVSSTASSSSASSATSTGSLALGKGSASVSASRTASAGDAQSTGAAGTEDEGASDEYTGATGNLEMMADVLLQLGNMVVMVSQKQDK